MVCSRKNPEKHLKELCALAELPAPPEAVAAVNCPGDWLLLALLSTYQAGVFHDYTGVRPAVLYDGPEGLALRLHRISGEEDGGAAMPAEEPGSQAPDPQPDEAALAFRYSHRAATVTPSKVTATQLKGRAIDQRSPRGHCRRGGPPHRRSRGFAGKARTDRGRARHSHAPGDAVSAAGYSCGTRGSDGFCRDADGPTAADAGAGGGAGYPGAGAVFGVVAGREDTDCAAGVAGVPLRVAHRCGYL